MAHNRQEQTETPNQTTEGELHETTLKTAVSPPMSNSSSPQSPTPLLGAFYQDDAEAAKEQRKD